MSKQIDHIKVSKRAKINKQGAEFIDPSDRTLLASGYPSARDLARSPPKKKSLGFAISPLVYKQETIEEARATIMRVGREKAEIRASRSSLKPTNTKASIGAGSEFAASAGTPTKDDPAKLHQENLKRVSEQYLGFGWEDRSPSKTPGWPRRHPDERPLPTVVQTLRRGRKRRQSAQRVVEVEIKPIARSLSPIAGKNQGRKP